MTDPNVDAETTASPDDSVPFAGLDIEIGPLAYGTARLGEATLDAAIDRIEAAVDAGMTLIETADVAGFDPTEEDAAHGGGFGAAEQRLGEVFAEVPELRDRVVLSTKGGVFPPLPFDTSADHLRQACDASLYRLGVDVIDLYQVHQPDLLAHPGEVAEVLTELREAGKVREVGVCNHTAWQTQALQSFLDFPLVSVQVPLNAVRLGSLTDGTLDLAMELGLTPIASSPLASGSLVGEATSKKLQAVAAVFDRIAAEQGAPRVAVVLSWLLHHPAGVVPIVSTSRVARIRQCAEATEVGFSRQQWYEVLAASRGQSLF
ncbi:MAG: aldo/keto reductase [Microthrixaceae bacterium]|jgi:predicted oxidoreductase